MEGKIANSLTGLVIGSLADLVLARLGFPKHTAKVIGAILGTLA